MTRIYGWAGGGCVAGWVAAGVLKFTTGALCAAALAANCTAGFWLEYSVLAQITPGKVRSSVL